MDDTGQANDDALVEATRKGDLTAFETLVARYRTPMTRLAYHFVRNLEDARDLSQDGFIRAFERLGRYRVGTRFNRWLARIVANCCRDHLRRRARARIESEAIPETLRASSPTPDQLVEAKELERRFREELDALPDEWRVVFLLREQEGMKHEEIAAHVGSNAATVRWRLHKARERLRQRLQELLE